MRSQWSAQEETATEAPVEAPGAEAADALAEPVDEAPDLEAPLLVSAGGADDDEKAVQPAPAADRSLLGLALYALSGFFLSTMLMLSKKLSARLPPGVLSEVREARGCQAAAELRPERRPAQHPRVRGAAGAERVPAGLCAGGLRLQPLQPLWAPVRMNEGLARRAWPIRGVAGRPSLMRGGRPQAEAADHPRHLRVWGHHELCAARPVDVRVRLLCRRPHALTAALPAADLVAVIMLPLNDAMVLTFTAPIWAAVLSPFVIKEQPSRCARAPARRCSALAQHSQPPAAANLGMPCAGADTLPARSATFFAILLCMAGVTLISRPSFLGFLQDVRRPYLGVFFALFQVRRVFFTKVF